MRKTFAPQNSEPLRVFAFSLALARNLGGLWIARQAKGGRPQQSEVIMNNYELREKAARAAVRFLERKGYEILDVDWVSREGTKVDLVANDGDCLVFIDLNVKEYSDGPLEGGKIPRSDFEVAAAGWPIAPTRPTSRFASTPSTCWS